jgi:hypothetical protein
LVHTVTTLPKPKDLATAGGVGLEEGPEVLEVGGDGCRVRHQPGGSRPARDGTRGFLADERRFFFLTGERL